MPKDIRKLTKNYNRSISKLSENHEEKFLRKLEQAFPKKKKSYTWMYAAASILLLIGFSVKVYLTETVQKIDTNNNIEQIRLGDISPEMKKVENYYLTAINNEMASLEVTQENKALLDVYFEKLGKLDVDYKRLNQQLEVEGINNKIINALITNLQLRLQLLIQLKDQVNDLQSKENKDENFTI